MHSFWKRCLAVQRCTVDVEDKGCKDPCGTLFLWRRNLLGFPLPVVRMKLELAKQFHEHADHVTVR